jgi:hypothetical protein
VAHSYTPGLRVTEHAVVRRERRLPLKGEVVVERGDRVEPDTVVARTELPGNVQTVNLAAKLAVDPAKVPSALTHPIGSAVKQGDLIASGKSLFGLVSQKVTAPCNGVLESVSGITGQLIVREPPIPVEVNAYVRGRVAEVLPQEGVIVETEAALIQGIFGVGGETFGTLAVVGQSPEEELLPSHLKPEHAGRVVVGGSYVSHAALMKAKELGIVAVVVGGFDDRDLRHLLGKDLGVAITGAEELGFTLVLTEGFGRIRMAQRTWRLLGQHVGHLCSVSGATQIRAGVMRPEILIPAETQPMRIGQDAGAPSGPGLEVGSLLRVIRQPYFGRIAEVVELPAELQELDTEAKVRVMVVQFTDDRSRAVVPRANVELIEP